MSVSKQIFKIQQFSIHDGPGIRTTLFFKGCPLSCVWCHNPESQGKPTKISSGQASDQAARLMETIEKDRIFYEDSGGGITFSGGEPLSQPGLLLKLAETCIRREIHTCLDTSGFAPFHVLEEISRMTDLILYDVKLMDETVHRRFTGVPPGLIQENLVGLSENSTRLLIRFPQIPGITDTQDNIRGLAGFIKNNTRYRDIHILPYHKAGDGKYEQMRRINQLQKTAVPTKKQTKRTSAIFESYGFNVTIGG